MAKETKFYQKKWFIMLCVYAAYRGGIFFLGKERQGRVKEEQRESVEESEYTNEEWRYGLRKVVDQFEINQLFATPDSEVLRKADYVKERI